MPQRKYLQELPLLEVIKFDRAQTYREEGVMFTGAPRKHPYDGTKIILLQSPFTPEAVFYEFKISDILYVEELPALVTETGETFKMVNVWIKKGSLGLRFQAFFVGSSNL
ncbi:MAG: hypothetical protein SNJ78_06170 [Spirochaetales bacterium]